MRGESHRSLVELFKLSGSKVQSRRKRKLDASAECLTPVRVGAFSVHSYSSLWKPEDFRAFGLPSLSECATDDISNVQQVSSSSMCVQMNLTHFEGLNRIKKVCGDFSIGNKNAEDVRNELQTLEKTLRTAPEGPLVHDFLLVAKHLLVPGARSYPDLAGHSHCKPELAVEQLGKQLLVSSGINSTNSFELTYVLLFLVI